MFRKRGVSQVVRPVCLLAGVLLAAQASHAQMEVAVQAGWSTFRGGKLGETTVLAYPQPVLLDVRLSDGFRAGAAITINQWEYLAHEVGYSYQRTHLKYTVSPKNPPLEITNREVAGEGLGVHTLCYNFVAHAARQLSRVRPFATAGLGGATIRHDRKFVANVGGGLKIRLSDRYGIRLDVRDYVIQKLRDIQITPEPGWQHNLAYSAGFSLFL
ncbi:MAG TPA: outer membrane beta-barrel protein [Bryobacteraceae bacterium]|nr:outer membrane beta-barrel protein [Bryobacteraceae bacterium]